MAYTGKSVDQNQSSRARIMTKEDMDREILNAVRSLDKPWQMLWWAGMLWCLLAAGVLAYGLGAFIAWDFLWLNSSSKKALFLVLMGALLPPSSPSCDCKSPW